MNIIKPKKLLSSTFVVILAANVGYSFAQDLSKLKPKTHQITTVQGPTGALLNSKKQFNNRVPSSILEHYEEEPFQSSQLSGLKNPTMDAGKPYPIPVRKK